MMATAASASGNGLLRLPALADDDAPASTSSHPSILNLRLRP
jgi:hypothetical protein